MALNPFISRKTLQQLQPLKANPGRKGSEAGLGRSPCTAPRRIRVRMGPCRWNSLEQRGLGSTFCAQTNPLSSARQRSHHGSRGESQSRDRSQRDNDPGMRGRCKHREIRDQELAETRAKIQEFAILQAEEFCLSFSVL